MTVAASSMTLAVSHLLTASGAAGGVRRCRRGCRRPCAAQVRRRRRRRFRPGVCGCVSRPWTSGCAVWWSRCRRPWRWPGAERRDASRCPYRRRSTPAPFGVSGPRRGRASAACAGRRSHRSRPLPRRRAVRPGVYPVRRRCSGRSRRPCRRTSRGRLRSRPVVATRASVSRPAGSTRRRPGADSRGPVPDTPFATR